LNPEILPDTPGFFTVRQLMKQGVSLGAVVTAAEGEGIFRLDRYGRFGKTVPGDEQDCDGIPVFKELVGRYLADLEAVRESSHSLNPYAEIEARTRFLDRWGWPCEQIPNFEELQKNRLDAVVETETIGDMMEREPAPNSVKNYLRLIRILAHMADIDISQPYKAADVVMAYASDKDLRAPSDAKTFGEKLSRAQGID